MNSELTFYYGAMGCGKTRELTKVYHSKLEDGFYPIIIKPSIDKKAGKKIQSRDKAEYDVEILVTPKDNIYIEICKYIIENNLDFILVDEAQFLESHHVDELSDVVDNLGITVICYGLKADFQTNLFPGSKRLLEISDNIIEMERQCSCGNKKIYNMRLANGIPTFEGEQIAIDGIDATYEAKCRKCYKKLKKEYKNK